MNQHPEHPCSLFVGMRFRPTPQITNPAFFPFTLNPLPFHIDKKKRGIRVDSALVFHIIRLEVVEKEKDGFSFEEMAA